MTTAVASRLRMSAAVAEVANALWRNTTTTTTHHVIFINLSHQRHLTTVELVLRTARHRRTRSSRRLHIMLNQLMALIAYRRHHVSSALRLRVIRRRRRVVSSSMRHRRRRRRDKCRASRWRTIRTIRTSETTTTRHRPLRRRLTRIITRMSTGARRRHTTI